MEEEREFLELFDDEDLDERREVDLEDFEDFRDFDLDFECVRRGFNWVAGAADFLFCAGDKAEYNEL